MITCGIDWAEGHHDVAVLDDAGRVLARRRIDTGITGFSELMSLLAEHAEDPVTVPVAIETDKNLIVVALQAAGLAVFAINPRAVARYRERHGQSGKKSDPGDAALLADVLRTDRHQHRTLPKISPAGLAVKALARQHQEAIWALHMTTSRLRSVLLEFYPQALKAFPNLKHKAALTVLASASTPELGNKMTRRRLVALLHRCGRRNDAALVEQIIADLTTPALRQPAPIETALGQAVVTLIGILTAMHTAVEQLETALETEFGQHQLAPILRSAPGLGPILAARVLAEVGDDANRFTHRERAARVRRHRPSHEGFRSKPPRLRPTRPQQAARRRLSLVGFRDADQVTRRTSPLRPAQSRGRPPQRRAPQPRQQAHRAPLVVPAERAALG